MYYRDKNGNKIDGKNIKDIQENYESKNVANIIFKGFMGIIAALFGWFIISVILKNVRINDNLKTGIEIIFGLIAGGLTATYI